ncbi:hypothetical protein [Paraburkholderia unamae]|uniref:HupE/UreJ protein n=1 Tax=Paraburkholderia unamae TaxID=219649 RepID=A0ABX5KE59_9BURK|nr:hypothetical protein [Paraburkholderia unamae]PVX75640.1 hypothetical protein C7402_11752 [Paraburkholderia unamae]RAR57843.1 hypothetical protein C7401_11462 [Paraburkholderia unamae]
MKELSNHHGLPALGLVLIGIVGIGLQLTASHFELMPGTVGDMCGLQLGTLLMVLGLAGACFIAGLLWRRAFDEQRALMFGFYGALLGAAFIFAS